VSDRVWKEVRSGTLAGCRPGLRLVNRLTKRSLGFGGVRLPRNAVAFPLTGTKAEELTRVTLEHFVPVRYRGVGRMILTDLVCSRERKDLALAILGR